MLASSILRMVIVRIPEDHGWVPAYPTSGTAIEFQFLSLFIIVSFLKVRVRARARKAVSVRSLMQRLDSQSDALAAADAQRDQAALETVAPHRVNEFCREHRAGRANRMAVSDCAALDIHNVVGQAEFTRDHDGDGGESLIDLDPLNRANIPAGALERLFDRRNRPEPEHARLDRGDAIGDEAGRW